MTSHERGSKELFDHFNHAGKAPYVHSVKDPDDKEDRIVFLLAEQDWQLEGSPGKGAPINIPMKAGKFKLTFRAHSRNLALVVIDPDPGRGE